MRNTVITTINGLLAHRVGLNIRPTKFNTRSHAHSVAQDLTDDGHPAYVVGTSAGYFVELLADDDTPEHTPGEWIYSEGRGTFRIIRDTNTPHKTYVHPMTLADKKLMAASPKLYALCERVAALNPEAGEIGAGMLAQLVEEANAAIAKARGK